jgi:competence protein ComEC
MLLTGDIEKSVEMQMPSVKSKVLLVPHHGSRSSSSPEFIAAVQPHFAIVPVGYRSRFGHPAPEVLERYRAAGTALLRTDLDGAVSVKLGARNASVSGERLRRGRYWLQ